MAYHLTHPDSKQEIEVDAERVALYTAQGWQLRPRAAEPETPDEAVIVAASEPGPIRPSPKRPRA